MYHDDLLHYLRAEKSGVPRRRDVTAITEHGTDVPWCHGGVCYDGGKIDAEVSDKSGDGVCILRYQGKLGGAIDVDAHPKETKICAVAGGVAGKLTKFVGYVDEGLGGG